MINWLSVKKAADWENVRIGLNDTLGTNKDVVEYASDPKMPTKHVVDYARQILKWHPDVDHQGQLEMYFNKKGFPIGYNFAGETGIHSDAKEEELMKAKIVARILKSDPRIQSLKTAFDPTPVRKRNKNWLDLIRMKKHEVEICGINGETFKQF